MTNYNKSPNLSINQCKILIQNLYDNIYYLKNLSCDEFSSTPREDTDTRLYHLEAGISSIATNKIELKHKLHKRKVKRIRIRKTKSKRIDHNETCRKEIHEKIDANLKTIAEQRRAQLERKREIENIKWKIRDVDNKLECSLNYQSTINGLVLLRTLRGAPDDGNNPEQVVDVLNKLKNYVSKLRETKQFYASSLNSLLPIQKNTADYTPELCAKLFGDSTYQANPLDRMSLEELVDARKYWDQYIVSDCDPDGSYIPQNWVGESDTSD